MRRCKDHAAKVHPTKEEMVARRTEEHREYLDAGLRGAGAGAPAAAAWRWVECRNPVAAFPIDFAVLEIRDARCDVVMAAVRAPGRVRDVHADATYSCSPLLASDRPWPPRREKLFTAMSFEGEEEGGGEGETGNTSSSTWGRRLLSQYDVAATLSQHKCRVI